MVDPVHRRHQLLHRRHTVRAHPQRMPAENPLHRCIPHRIVGPQRRVERARPHQVLEGHFPQPSEPRALSQCPQPEVPVLHVGKPFVVADWTAITPTTLEHAAPHQRARINVVERQQRVERGVGRPHHPVAHAELLPCAVHHIRFPRLDAAQAGQQRRSHTVVRIERQHGQGSADGATDVARSGQPQPRRAQHLIAGPVQEAEHPHRLGHGGTIVDDRQLGRRLAGVLDRGDRLVDEGTVVATRNHDLNTGRLGQAAARDRSAPHRPRLRGGSRARYVGQFVEGLEKVRALAVQ